MKNYLIGLLLCLLCAGCAAKKQTANLNKPIRVVIVGNSITWHRPAPQLGWKGDWGMAASKKELDYVHLLIGRFKAMNSATEVKYANIADFERKFWDYDYKRLDSLRDFKADIVILRIGENVDTATIARQHFIQHLKTLATYLKSNNPRTKLYFVSSFWKRVQTDAAMQAVAKDLKGVYLTLNTLEANRENFAYGQFENAGVAMHPSDKGMAGIANIIWQSLLTNQTK